MNFPTSVEAFATFQEEHIRRKLTAFERELCEPLVELINIYYEIGKEGRCMDDLLEDIAQFYIKEGHAERLQKPSVQHICRSIDLWCRKAYETGKGCKFPFPPAGLTFH